MAFFHTLLTYVTGNPPVAASLGAVFAFLFLDVVLGILAAVQTKTFQLVKLADFVGGDLLKALVVAAFGMGATQNTYVGIVFYAGAAALLGTLAAKINANFQTVFGVNPHITPPSLPQTPPTSK